MVWCRLGNKPLPEPMLIQLTPYELTVADSSECEMHCDLLHKAGFPWTDISLSEQII